MSFSGCNCARKNALYLPSIGYCILLPNLISLTLRFLQAEQILDDTRRTWIIGNIRSSSIKRSLLVSLTIWFTYKTYIRNEEWATPMKLYQSATKVVPRSCKAWVCLASAYKDIGDYEDARRSASKALEIKQNFAGAFYLLGTMEEELGNVDAAIRNYELTIKHSLYTEFKPYMLRVSLNNVGLLYFKRKKNLKQGLHAFQEGLKLPEQLCIECEHWRVSVVLAGMTRRFCREQPKETTGVQYAEQLSYCNLPRQH